MPLPSRPAPPVPTSNSRPRRARVAAWLALVLLALAASAGGAAAHTRLDRSAPAAGDTVRALTEVRLVFTQGVEPRYTQMRLVGPAGAVALGPVREVPGSRRREYVAQLAQLADPGAYRVEWRTAGADGHPVTGTFAFTLARDPALAATGVLPAGPGTPTATVAPAPAPPADVPPHAEGVPHPTPGLERWVRWLDFAALLLAVGATAFHHLVARRLAGDGFGGAAEGASRRAARVALLAGLAMLPALAGRLGVQSALLHGAEATWDAGRVATLVWRTQWGVGWMLQAGAACVFLAAALLAARASTRAAGWALAVPAAAALCAVPALSGHAAAVEGWRGAAIGIDALHVAGAGAWLGTLAVLLAAIPVVLRGDGGHAALAALVNRFSPVALTAGGLAGATGVANALFHLRSLEQLTGTAYGQTLLWKLALLVVVAGLGLYNWRRVRPRLGTPGPERTLRRVAAVEVAVGVLVVAVTAALVALPTP